MTDSELRGIVLRRFYDRRLEQFFEVKLNEFDDQFSFVELQNICRQLSEKGLVGKWHPAMTGGGPSVGIGQITAEGVDVVEGNTTAPISITFDHSSTVAVTSSQNVQIGNNNNQNVVGQFQILVDAIDASNATPAEKLEAKSLLRKVLEHPVVAAIVGGLASTL